jgi:hypothetical protein
MYDYSRSFALFQKLYDFRVWVEGTDWVEIHAKELQKIPHWKLLQRDMLKEGILQIDKTIHIAGVNIGRGWTCKMLLGSSHPYAYRLDEKVLEKTH